MQSPLTETLSHPWALMAKAIGQRSDVSGVPFLMHFAVMSALNTSFCFFMGFLDLPFVIISHRSRIGDEREITSFALELGNIRGGLHSHIRSDVGCSLEWISVLVNEDKNPRVLCEWCHKSNQRLRNLVVAVN